MENADDYEFASFLSETLDEEEEDIVQYNSVWNCPKINKFTNEANQKVWTCCWCPDNIDGTVSKHLATLLALVGRASANAQARFQLIIIGQTTNCIYDLN